MATFFGPGSITTPTLRPKQEAVAPPGWERTVRKMKKNGGIDNPFALAWWMKNHHMHPAKRRMQALYASAQQETRSITDLMCAAQAGDESAMEQLALASCVLQDLQRIMTNT